jgi:hypothetical protein
VKVEKQDMPGVFSHPVDGRDKKIVGYQLTTNRPSCPILPQTYREKALS